MEVLNLRPVEWRVEVITQLVEQGAGLSYCRFPLIEHLVRDTGCPVPTSDAFLNAWLADRNGDLEDHRATSFGHLRGGSRGTTLLDRLRADDFAPQLLPLAVARPGVPLRTFTTTFVGLAADGVIDRDALIRSVLAELIADPPFGTATASVLDALALSTAERAATAHDRATLAQHYLAILLQGEDRMQADMAITFLRTLAPTPAEHALAVRDHVALLDGSLPVAAYAQEVLMSVDEAGLLEVDLLTEVCERVLLRPEKKLVRAQLGWLGRVAGRGPVGAGRVLADAAITFGHRDVALQEQALKLVARHLKKAGDGVLPQLRTAAEQLSPGLAPRAGELFGTAQDGGAGAYIEVLPVVPEPRAVPGPIATIAELVQEVAAVVAGDQDVAAFERALDGLVRHACLDRDALAQALRPVLRKKPRERRDCMQADLFHVARAVCGDEPKEETSDTRLKRDILVRISTRPGKMLAVRMVEAIDVIEAGTQPFLLAVPTLATGALDPAVLIGRMSALDELGVTPAPVDLAQALLRVTPTTDEHVLHTAETLGSDAGQRLARWLRDGGLPHQETAAEKWKAGWPPPQTAGLVLDPPLPPAAADLIGPFTSMSSLSEPPEPFWVAQLPHHREEVMTRHYFAGVWGWPRILPFVAESGGPAGAGVHRVLAAGLCNPPGDRDPAVDALLVLAARGQLDGGLLGRSIGGSLRAQLVTANTATEALRAVAETGAYGTAWSIIEGALPAVLGDPPVRGVGQLLGLGADCASRCGATGEIAEVAALAKRTGSNQVVKAARLLHDVLR